MLSTKHKKNKPQTKGNFSKAGSTSNKRKCNVLEDNDDNLDDHPKKKNKMSPYLIFSADVRPLINNEHPGLSLMQISKISGKRWKMLTQQEKNTYKEKSKAANDTIKKEQEEERIKTEKQKILKKLNKKEQRFYQEKTSLLKLANNSTFQTLVEDILLILFDFLDPRDIAAMAQVEVFLNKFVNEKYFTRLVIPIGEWCPEFGTGKPVLRLESECKLPEDVPYQYHIQQLNLKKLKELKFVDHSTQNRLSGDMLKYNNIIEMVLEKAPMLTKMEIMVHGSNIFQKCPKGLKELWIDVGRFELFRTYGIGINFGNPAYPSYRDKNSFRKEILHKSTFLSSVLQDALNRTEIRKLKLCNAYATENYILDLKSETLVTLEFDTLRTTTQFTLQDLKCPNLTSIKVTEVMKKGTKLSLCKGKVLKQIKSQCPKLKL